MAKLEVRHLRVRTYNGIDGYYFIPSKTMFDYGFRPCPLGKDRAKAVAYVDAQNVEYDKARAEAKSGVRHQAYPLH